MADSDRTKGFTTYDSPDTPHDLNRGIAERIAFIPAPGSPSRARGSESLRSRLLRLYEDNQGLLLIGAAQFFGPCMNISVQMLNRLDPPVPPTEILVVRQSITWALTLTYMWYQDVSYPILGPPEVRFLLVIRGICGFCGVFAMYYALQYLSLSDATVLTFLTPIFTSFAGTFFLGETFSRRSLYAGLCSLIGVVLIARPEALFGPAASAVNGGHKSAERGTPHQRLVAVAISMIGVFGASGAYTSLRAIGKRAHSLHSMTYFAMISGLLSAIMMIVVRTKPVIPTQWAWGALLLLISLFGFVSQMLLITGLQRETASRGSLAMYIQIVFASGLERIFFHVRPSLLSLLGTAIILSSALYIALTKAKENQDQPIQRRRNTMEWEDNEDAGDPPNDDTVERTPNSQVQMVNVGEEEFILLEEGLVIEDEDREDNLESTAEVNHTVT